MLKLAHERAVALILPLWLLGLAWLTPRMAIAATVASYDQGARAYNWLALGLAAGTGLWGGVLMLILALSMDQRVVTQVLREGLRNAVASPITGMFGYGLLEGSRVMGWYSPTFEVSFLVITLFGMAGVKLVAFAQSIARAGAPKVRDGLIDMLVSWLQRGRAPKPPQDPTP